MKPADPLDLAVSRAFNRMPPPSPHKAAQDILAAALGVGTFSPLTIEVAEIVFSFDQEAIEQPWARLTEHRRQPYYDIAEAVLAHLETRGKFARVRAG